MYSDFISEPFFSEIYQDIIADLTQRLWSRPHGYDTAHPLIPFIVVTAICSVLWSHVRIVVFCSM